MLFTTRSAVEVSGVIASLWEEFTAEPLPSPSGPLSCLTNGQDKKVRLMLTDTTSRHADLSIHDLGTQMPSPGPSKRCGTEDSSVFVHQSVDDVDGKPCDQRADHHIQRSVDKIQHDLTVPAVPRGGVRSVRETLGNRT